MIIDVELFKEAYDWKHAFWQAVHGECEPWDVEGGEHPIDKVAEVLYAVEGERDQENWTAIGRYIDGKYFHISAGCDYTGWDCRAWGTMEAFDTLSEAIEQLTPWDCHRIGIEHDAFLPPQFTKDDFNTAEGRAIAADHWEDHGDEIKAAMIRRMNPDKHAS